MLVIYLPVILPKINSSNKYLVVIAGPTAVGKTSAAIKLAKHYHTEILSADSRQFYKEMSIGTAKPLESELSEVKHHFISCKSVQDPFNVGQFEREAIELLTKLFQEHNIVFMVGGSGLYINAVLNGVDYFEEIPTEIRTDLNNSFEKYGITWLQTKLKELDPVYFEQVDILNPQRIIRALEVCLHTGKAYSSFLNKNKSARNFTSIPIFLNTSREKLYEQINLRVDAMMSMGLLEEVKALKDLQHLNALKTVGYSELFDYLNHNSTREEAVSKIKQHTRNYAKRQITWFKHQGDFEEFEPIDIEKIKAYIDIITSHA